MRAKHKTPPPLSFLIKRILNKTDYFVKLIESLMSSNYADLNKL